jgi:hypothetical protein
MEGFPKEGKEQAQGLGEEKLEGFSLRMSCQARKRKAVSPRKADSAQKLRDRAGGGCHLRIRALVCVGSPPQLLLVSVRQAGSPQRSSSCCPWPNPASGRSLACTPPPACEAAGEAVVGRLPRGPGLGRGGGRRRLLRDRGGWAAARGVGLAKAGEERLAWHRAVTDSGGDSGSGPARSPRAHTHTPPRRHRTPAACGHTDAETRAARAPRRTASSPRGARRGLAGCAPSPRILPRAYPQPRGPAARPAANR